MPNIDKGFFVETTVGFQHGKFLMLGIKNNRDRCLLGIMADKAQFPAIFFQLVQCGALLFVEFGMQHVGNRRLTLASFLVSHSVLPSRY